MNPTAPGILATTPAAGILVFVASLLLFLVVLWLAFRRVLGIEYSILWLVLTVGGMLTGLGIEQADEISKLVGVSYPPAFFFLICIVVLLAIILHLTIRLSRIAEAQVALAREMALLRSSRTSDSADLKPAGGPSP